MFKKLAFKIKTIYFIDKKVIKRNKEHNFQKKKQLCCIS